MNKQELILSIEKFQSLNLSSIIDFDKFNGYTITHHSTTIEGSTLTEIETRLLLDEGITPAGKPLLHSLMVQDHYNALLFITKKAKEKKETSFFYFLKHSSIYRIIADQHILHHP